MKTVPWVLAVVFGGLLLLGNCNDGSEAEARAATLESAIPALQAQRDSARLRVAELETASAVKDRAYADSLQRWEADRARNRAQVAQATRRASEAAAALAPRLDSIGAALLAEYQAEVDAREDANAQIIASLEVEVEALRERIALRDSLIAGLRVEVDAERAISDQLTAANEALHDALRAKGRRQWGERLVGVAAIGLAIYLGG